MSTTLSRSRRPVAGRPSRSRRFGYLVSIAVNAAMVYVVHHLLEWGWPRFLTEAFEELLPVITLSFVAGIVVNLGFLCSTPPGSSRSPT